MTDPRHRRHTRWLLRWLLGLALGAALGAGIGALRGKPLLYCAMGFALGGTLALASGRRRDD